MRATGNYCSMRPVCDEEAEGEEMVADLLNTAGVALLLLLLSARSQLLLGYGHLLLHVADLLLGAATVLLEEQTDDGGTQTNIAFQSVQQTRVYTHKVHCMTQSLNVTPICASLTSYSKTSGVNILLQQPPLLREGLPRDLGTWPQRLALIQPHEH